MKKLFIIVIVVCLSISVLAGCNNKKDEVDEPNNQSQEPQDQNAPVPTEASTDLSALTDEEIFVFDPATNTLSGFQESILGVTDLIIPNEINGAAVLVIASNAFNNKDLNSVVFPDKLEKIGTNAFSENKLTQVVFPSSLSTIEISAFQKNELTEVNISPSITKINTRVFADNQLTKITLPDTITHIGRSAFAVNKLTEITIPPLVKVIESFAFQDNLIENVVFNDGLERIDGRAFLINKLTSITIPASVKLIGAASEGVTPPTNYERFPFAYNPQLTSITMLGSNTELAPFFLAENNKFSVAYLNGGAGTYTGTQYGKWAKSD